MCIRDRSGARGAADAGTGVQLAQLRLQLHLRGRQQLLQLRRGSRPLRHAQHLRGHRGGLAAVQLAAQRPGLAGPLRDAVGLR
eukprot:2527519-Prorocentrum_lima.AAC.1